MGHEITPTLSQCSSSISPWEYVGSAPGGDAIAPTRAQESEYGEGGKSPRISGVMNRYLNLVETVRWRLARLSQLQGVGDFTCHSLRMRW